MDALLTPTLVRTARGPERATIHQEYKSALAHLEQEAAAIAATAARIAQTVQEVQAEGGQVRVEPQVNFLTGAFARMLKDLGRIEHLQQHGVMVKRVRI